MGSWPLCGVTSLRLALCSSACNGSGGCPSFWQVGSAPSLWVPLLRAGCVWGFHSFAFAYSFGMWSPFGSRVSFSLLIANEGLPWWFFLSDVVTPFWGRAVVFLRPSDCRHFWWLVAALVTGLGQWAVFSWPLLLLSFES